VKDLKNLRKIKITIKIKIKRKKMETLLNSLNKLKIILKKDIL
jgi:hypothetical protein